MYQLPIELENLNNLFYVRANHRKELDYLTATNACEEYKKCTARTLSITEKLIDEKLKFITLPSFVYKPLKPTPMSDEDYALLQNKYYTLVKQITDLQKVIINTNCLVKLALFNSDMRDLITERETIYKDLIEWKA